jgi:hypothetical protein
MALVRRAYRQHGMVKAYALGAELLPELDRTGILLICHAKLPPRLETEAIASYERTHNVNAL